MESIDKHIEQDREELSNPNISPQRRRHVEGELEQLESYKKNHPDETHDPSPLELYCDANPEEPECRIYED